jgi:hypothetical protein
MIGVQWMKNSPRVIFKDAVSGPHTARSDGGFNLKDYFIYTFDGLLRDNFYYFLENKFKQFLTIRSIHYDNKYADYKLFEAQGKEFREQLLNTCCRRILTTHKKVTSVNTNISCRWIFNFNYNSTNNRDFLLAILGPCNELLTIEATFNVNQHFNPTEILNLIIQKLSLEQAFNQQFDSNLSKNQIVPISCNYYNLQLIIHFNPQTIRYYFTICEVFKRRSFYSKEEEV